MNKKPLKTAAIFGIISFFIPFISLCVYIPFYLYTKNLYIFYIINFIISLPVMWLFYKGFLLLGKKYNNKLMKYSSIFFMISPIIFFIFSVYYMTQIQAFFSVSDYINIIKTLFANQNNTDQLQNYIMMLYQNMLPILTLQSIISIFIYYLPIAIFSTALIKIKNDFKLTKITGYIGLISSMIITVISIYNSYQLNLIHQKILNPNYPFNYNLMFNISIIASIISIIALTAIFVFKILQIVLLFKASEKIEGK